ncbi:uncharacterized protein [Pleurodeles waltl]
MTNDLFPVLEDLDSCNDLSRSTLGSHLDTHSVVAATISNPEEELDLEAPNYDPPEPLLCSEVLDECDAMSDTSLCPEIPEEGPMEPSSAPKPQGPEGCAAVSSSCLCPEVPEKCPSMPDSAPCLEVPEECPTMPDSTLCSELPQEHPTMPDSASCSEVPEKGSTIDEPLLCPGAPAGNTIKQDLPLQAGGGALNNLPCQVVAPIRPTTLDLSQSLRKHVEEAKTLGPRTNSDHSEVNENGVESCPEAPQITEEKRALEGELHKCIEDFHKIRIPKAFPNKKRHWQTELLKKYHL